MIYHLSTEGKKLKREFTMNKKEHHKHEQRIVADKTDRQRYHSIWKGILVVMLVLIVIWFVFGFLGFFF
ncbi:hypothetical protein [Bartonella sp. B30(2025)]